jgi:hypothetical protein
VGQTQLGSFWSLMTNQSNNTRENGKVPFVQFPQLQARLEPGSGHVGFVVDKAALG